MKALILSSTIFLFVILSTVFVAFYSNKLLSDISSDIEKSIPINDYETAYRGMHSIISNYENKKPFFILFMRGKDTQSTEEYIEDLKNAIESEDASEITAAKSRLMLHIEQLRRLSVFSWEAIF